MSESSTDAGVIKVLMDRFETQRLPRALDLKERVDQGELLSESDMAFLKEVFEDSKHIKPLLDRHPEYQPLAAQVMELYHLITEQALKNEEGK